MATAKPYLRCLERPGETFTVHQAAALAGVTTHHVYVLARQWQLGQPEFHMGGFHWGRLEASKSGALRSDGPTPAVPSVDRRRKIQEADYDRELVAGHMAFVRELAKGVMRTLPRGQGVVDVEDLQQAGVFGLIRAAQTFDPERGVKFTSYAGLKIRGAILQHLRELDWVPRLARRRGEPVPRFTSASQPMHRDQGSDRAAGATVGQTLIDYRVQSRQQRREHRDQIDRLLRGVEQPLRTAYLLYEIYGLLMSEIGFVMGLSESRASQIHTQATTIVKAKAAMLSAEEAEELDDIVASSPQTVAPPIRAAG